MVAVTRIYLEQGARVVFAVALDWPGWCRSAKSADEAMAALERYRPRYELIVGESVDHLEYELISELAGNSTTDFGAPAMSGPFDTTFTDADRCRHLDVLDRHWTYFDRVVDESPLELVKGPRGGGRDRDAVARHAQEAERHYAAKCGARVAPRTDWPTQRAMVRGALDAGLETAWPVSYAIRRIAWHLSDHAWEIEDRRSR